MPIPTISELHNIMPIENIPSVMEYGILSNRLIIKHKISRASVALSDVQMRRENKSIPGGKPLHDYANLYFDAHNPMLSRVREQNETICILQVSPQVMNLLDVVLVDQNAASNYAKFYPYPKGLEYLNFPMIYASNWKHNDQISEWQHKSIKCAEILIPDRVESTYIMGAYVYNKMAETRLKTAGFNATITIKADMFF
jgi:hypothetical protein